MKMADGTMDVEENIEPFDYQAYEREAIAKYLRVQPFYQDFSHVVARIIKECLKKHRINIHSVQNRSKDASSFGRKASIPSEADPNQPKYKDPLRNITDLAGVRIITHFPATLIDIDSLLKEEFVIIEKSDKGQELMERERFGYKSVHYLLKIRHERAQLAEYERFSDAIAEVQVRTILQHAWAEIEHDIQYKSSIIIPFEIRRRFMALAGMLEVADREFQAIQDADVKIGNYAKVQVERGNLDGVEITPNALKMFLDKRLGPDGRISDWTYDWTARLVKKLGFSDLKQIENAISPYNDDRLSGIATGGRQGQTSRFELMLLAALGERFFSRHTYSGQDWFLNAKQREFQKLQEAGIQTSTYNVEADSSTGQGSDLQTKELG